MKRNLNRKVVWVPVVGVLILVVLLLIGWGVGNLIGGDDDDDTATPAEQTTQSAAPDDPDNENLPGAAVGNEQRTWPNSLASDDSAHKTPGEWSVDEFDRPVWTPNNHEGDLPDTVNTDGDKVCDTGNPVDKSKNLQIQYVNGRYLVSSDQAGPSTMTRGVPHGYSHDLPGAALAAVNQAVYGMYTTDEVGAEALDQLWSTSKEAKEDAKSHGIEGPEEAKNGIEPTRLPAPEAVKVETCSDNAVVIKVAMKTVAPNSTGDGPVDQYGVYGVPLTWQDGDWKADYSGDGDRHLSVDRVDTIDDFDKIEYTS